LPSKLAESEGHGRTLALARLIGSPTDGELEEINACLARIEEILWGTDTRAPATISLGWVMAPITRAK